MTPTNRSRRVLILDVPAAHNRAGLAADPSTEANLSQSSIPQPWSGMTEREAEDMLFDAYVIRRTKSQ
ncbi:MAG: hypothetical protein ABJA67_11040 [Chthonomonadales bacterium]